MGEIVLALNTKEKEQALSWVKLFKDRVRIFKIGLPLFSHYGPSIVEEIKDEDVKIFLDMKLHDIPSVVGDSVLALRELGVDYITVHLTGGMEMAKSALEAAGDRVEIIGVTILTSLDKEKLERMFGVALDVNEVVSNLVEEFTKVGGKNVVLSGREAPDVKRKFGVRVFVPGIRFANEASGDQSRVVTPEFARKYNFDFIVVGRSVTHAPEPEKALDRLIEEFYGA